MSIFWFVIGLAVACIFMWLQWLQIKNLSPGGSTSRMSISLLFILRLVFFAVVAGIAFRESLKFGIVLFAGFWTARSFLLFLIGTGRFSWGGRRHS